MLWLFARTVRLSKRALRRSGWAERATLQIDATSVAAIALFEHLARHENPCPAPAQRVSPQRRLIARQHDQRDEKLFDQLGGAFTDRHRRCGRNELESVATDQTHHLVIALPATELHGASHKGNVVKIGA